MRMTSTGAFPRALAAARPPKPPPTITTRGLCGFRPSPCPFELRVESLIYLFLKLLSPEISENLLFSTDWWGTEPRQEDLMTLLDRFFHYLPPFPRQWSHAASWQTPQSFVLAVAV